MVGVGRSPPHQTPNAQTLDTVDALNRPVRTEEGDSREPQEVETGLWNVSQSARRSKGSCRVPFGRRGTQGNAGERGEEKEEPGIDGDSAVLTFRGTQEDLFAARARRRREFTMQSQC